MIQTFNIHDVRLSCNSSVDAASEQLRDRLRPYITDENVTGVLRLHIEPATIETSELAMTIESRLQWIRSRPLWGDLSDATLRFTDGHSTAEIFYEQRRARLHVATETVLDRPFFRERFCCSRSSSSCAPSG